MENETVDEKLCRLASRVEELEEALDWALSSIPTPRLIKGQNDRHFAAYERAEKLLAGAHAEEKG